MSKDDAAKDRGLKDYGIIYISGAIEDGASQSICTEIIQYNISNRVDHIQLIIISCGGSCSAGFAIIDIMEWSQIPVFTTGIGMVASMGLMLFMTGHKGRRVITPRTSILSHRYSAMTLGNHSQLLASRKEQDLEHARIVEHYLRYTNLNSREELEKYLLRDVDTWLSAEEAVQFGLADIVEPINRLAGAERR